MILFSLSSNLASASQNLDMARLCSKILDILFSLEEGSDGKTGFESLLIHSSREKGNQSCSFKRKKGLSSALPQV